MAQTLSGYVEGQLVKHGDFGTIAVKIAPQTVQGRRRQVLFAQPAQEKSLFKRQLKPVTLVKTWPPHPTHASLKKPPKTAQLALYGHVAPPSVSLNLLPCLCSPG